MDFLISDTFTDSLARLTGDEQKAVKTTAFDLQMNPANPGHNFHKLEKGKDKNFWSVRVNADIRMIVHRSDSSLLLCYVDHHDKAYAWAERRKLETHPKTGAAQLVEIRETVKEIFIPTYVEAPVAAVPASTPAPKPAQPKKALFAHLSDEELLGVGVPTEWVKDVQVAGEETFFNLAAYLPAEASEALLEVATGGKLRLPKPPPPAAGPFAHPDAKRRFRVVGSSEELQRALEFPWDKWSVFLHPEQRYLVERDYPGPAKVAGTAGTGKTIVALHRAVHLARKYPDARVLLTTFSDTLASALQTKLKRLVSGEPHLGERIDVRSIDAVGARLYKSLVGPFTLATDAEVRDLLKGASAEVGGHKFSLSFLVTEWEQVVDAWQLGQWEAYRDVVRLGRKTRLPEPQRAVLWSIFEKVRAALEQRKAITRAGLFTRLAEAVAKSKHPPYEFAVVDEAQDLAVPHLRFLAALGGSRPEALFFAGDLGQRIFQQPFSWKSLGIDLRGRGRILRVNYRTSQQIRAQADKLLGPEISDVDGNTEERTGAVSVFNGPLPEIRVAKNPEEECRMVADWLAGHAKNGVAPHELGVFVRSDMELERARAAAAAAGVPFKVLDEQIATTGGSLSICTMHLAKGLEFRAVAVMACDDEILPNQTRIETAAEESDLEEVYNTERHLLYVACTRARDFLLVSGVDPVSEFLRDMQ